jgi:hypothetical protein
MLKLLRNFALAGLLLAGIMKLLAWWVVGGDVEHVVAALAPYAQIKYEGVSTGLDGSITLDKVSVDAGHRVYRADTVVFEAPSLFWLFGHAFMGGNSLPAQFSLSADGLKLPPMPWLDPQVFDPATFVPFPTAGCGNSLSDADYQRMGVPAGPTHERLDYHYDADLHTLTLALNLKAPSFAQVDVEADLKKFDPDKLLNSAMWDQAHLDQVTTTYTDLDYLAKRSQFCAQRNGGAPGQFVERHIAATQELLKQKRAEPSPELVQLYRNLLEHGGQASLLSLPSAGFVLAAVHNAPDELLRQLNVTARYKDKPPIMFRVAFTPAPEETPATAASEPAQTPATATATAVAPTSPPPATPSSSPTKPTATTQPAPAPTVVKSPPPNNTPAPTPNPPPAVSPPVAPTVAAATQPATPVTAPAAPRAPDAGSVPKPASDNLGLHSLDRDEARLAAITPPLAVPPKRELRPAPGSSQLGPSAAAPPAGSLEASLWKPSVYETLPYADEEKNYDIIDFVRLPSMVGHYVQVITEGGKKIGGFVLGVDEVGVTLQVNREGGNITFVVPRTRLQEVRLPRY